MAKIIGNNAIGQHLIFYKDEYFEIAGIIENFEDQSLKSETLPKVIKLNNEYDPQFLYIRISGNNIPETLKYVGNVFKKHGIRDFESTSMEGIFNNFSKDEDILMRFIGFVSVICLIISIFGIYSLTLYSMERRRREIAIRKVMGASANNIIRIFLKEYMWLVLIASVIAIPPAYYIMTNWLQAYANRISITWWLIAVIIIIVTAIVVITILRQIIKAANSNPAEVIKYE